jgi:hypothetical protein
VQYRVKEVVCLSTSKADSTLRASLRTRAAKSKGSVSSDRTSYPKESEAMKYGTYTMASSRVRNLNIRFVVVAVQYNGGITTGGTNSPNAAMLPRTGD